MPERLFKYLPQRWVETLVDRGNLLFRSLSYFHLREHNAARGDPYEGTHVDYPDNDVTLHNAITGELIYKGRSAFVRRVEVDRIYCFCLSMRLSDDLFDEFESDQCIEIVNVPEFLRRFRRAVSRLKSAAEWETLNRPVEYYDPNKAVASDITEPRNLPFFKVREPFAQQDEFRLVAARRSAFVQKQRIFKGAYNPAADNASVSGAIRFRAGSLSDIVRVHRV